MSGDASIVTMATIQLGCFEAATIVPYFNELLPSLFHKHIFLASHLSSDVSERFVALMEQLWVRGGH